MVSETQNSANALFYVYRHFSFIPLLTTGCIKFTEHVFTFFRQDTSPILAFST